MNEPKQSYYVVIIIERGTLSSQAILCSGYAQLQMLLDNLDEVKYHLSAVEVDDVCAYVEYIEKDHNIKEEDDPNFPFEGFGNNLN